MSEAFLKPLTIRFNPCSFVELVAEAPQAQILGDHSLLGVKLPWWKEVASIWFEDF